MMTRVYAASAAALAALLLGATGYMAVTGRGGASIEACRDGQPVSDAIGGDFTLVNAEGETVTNEDVIDEPSLVYFGYTSCPDICPMDNARNASAVDILQEQGYAVQPVFISIDPARDTPKLVGQFASAMSPDMIGLTGSPEQVKAASDAYHASYSIPHPEKAGHLVNHSTFTYLVLPDRGFVKFFRRDVAPKKMAEQVSCFLDV